MPDQQVGFQVDWLVRWKCAKMATVFLVSHIMLHIVLLRVHVCGRLLSFLWLQLLFFAFFCLGTVIVNMAHVLLQIGRPCCWVIALFTFVFFTSVDTTVIPQIRRPICWEITLFTSKLFTSVSTPVLLQMRAITCWVITFATFVFFTTVFTIVIPQIRRPICWVFAFFTFQFFPVCLRLRFFKLEGQFVE